MCGYSTPPWKRRPVCIIWWPVSWTAAAVWYTLRMSAYLSACFAMRGKFSEISMPGTLVLMGL